MLAKVMEARRPPGLGADLGGVKERADHMAESRAGIGRSSSSVVPQQWAVRRTWQLSGPPNVKIPFDFAGAIHGERHHARFVKL
jgi:hypothetical protein